jgi:hypothetical protein
VFAAPWLAPPAATALIDVITEMRRDTGDF